MRLVSYFKPQRIITRLSLLHTRCFKASCISMCTEVSVSLSLNFRCLYAYTEAPLAKFAGSCPNLCTSFHMPAWLILLVNLLFLAHPPLDRHQKMQSLHFSGRQSRNGWFQLPSWSLRWVYRRFHAWVWALEKLRCFLWPYQLLTPAHLGISAAR